MHDCSWILSAVPSAAIVEFPTTSCFGVRIFYSRKKKLVEVNYINYVVQWTDWERGSIHDSDFEISNYKMIRIQIIQMLFISWK